VIGMMPLATPMLTSTWVANMPTIPVAIATPNSSRARRQIAIDRIRTTANSPSTSNEPRNPHSSARMEKMKSVLC
jgi:hypothetical protein